MEIQKMDSQGGDGGSNEKKFQVDALKRQNSMYSLTLDEVENQLGDLGKPLSSMNLDELLKNVWTAETSQPVSTDIEATKFPNQSALQHEASVALTRTLSKKTVDEVWKDIQQSTNIDERKSPNRKFTLGEMTLEDFLVKAGIVAESSSSKKANNSNVSQQFPQQGQWLQYPQPQYQHPPQQNMMGVYMPGQPIQQSLPMATGSVMDVSYPENQVAAPSPVMSTLSDTPTSGRRRGDSDNIMEISIERRRKRMIKNRESAARSRARKQAYTTELENKVSWLEEENERLRKWKELEQMFPCSPPPEPKCLRRTSSSAF